MKFAPALTLIGVLFLAAFATEPNTARPGGNYATFTAASAQACSAACADDSLCMAWTHSETNGSCELKAVVPAPIDAIGAVSGVADRARAFARLVAAPPAAPAEQPLPSPPQEVAIAPASPRPDQQRADDPTDDFGDNLLGGPENAPHRQHLPGA